MLDLPVLPSARIRKEARFEDVTCYAPDQNRHWSSERSGDVEQFSRPSTAVVRRRSASWLIIQGLHEVYRMLA